MTRRAISRPDQSLMRRLLACLLVCLMLPGSIADASSFVWCFSGDGHSAIERCYGHQCHSSAPRNAEPSTGDALELGFVADQHHADCTDVELLPAAALSTVRSTDVEQITLGGSGSLGLPDLVGRASKSWLFTQSGCKRSPISSAAAGLTDPTVLLRRIAVLRI